jgi:hypothetical protein
MSWFEETNLRLKEIQEKLIKRVKETAEMKVHHETGKKKSDNEMRQFIESTGAEECVDALLRRV